MANYLLLYTGGGGGTPVSEVERVKIMQAWTDWFTNLGEAVVDLGNPTSPGAKKIDSQGNVTEGPVGTIVTGYSILKAENLDKAVSMAKGCPNIQSGGQVTVYETFNVM